MPLDARPFDALLFVSFGGPEQPDDVVPFLENVTAGRGIPRERLVEVGEHYFAFGGRSPINDQNRDLLAALRQDLEAAGVDLPVYWGNRNWDPYLTDAMAQMRDDGVQHAACFVTSAYSSYSGCRQYRENFHDALEVTGEGAPRLSKLRHYFNHPGFVEPFVDATVTALARLDEAVRDEAEIVFVTHSIPTAMNEASGRHDGTFGGAYVHQHSDVATEVARRVHDLTGVDREFTLVYCSRSGSPRTPWLEPDVNDHLREVAQRGGKAVVVVPIGFVSDHMEVVYDLDTEARETAAELGLAFQRASTPGVNPQFVSMVRDLLLERAAHERGEVDVPQATVGALAPSWDVCPVGCCANARGERPAACGMDS